MGTRISINGGKWHDIDHFKWESETEQYLSEEDFGTMWHYIPLAPTLVIESESRWFDEVDGTHEFRYNISWENEHGPYTLKGSALLDNINARLGHTERVFNNHPIYQFDEKTKYVTNCYPVRDKDGRYSVLRRKK